ncbi:GNAT family N-acetyltransferase [Pseudactinotalea terrae]|uniref:GNAT family N-acetyltransferase n=1 Tax=Pseudactinotalea terrae TaxID=1743262 RepID=UPI0012E273C0|nr:GNAT family N-acetyltransferase [Pseudactinotalea terrae]
MPDSPDVVVRRAEDCELERVVQLRWVWEAETDNEPGDRESFVTAAAAWARAHRETHIAVTARGTVVGMAWLALTPRVATTHDLDRWSGDLQSCYVLPSRRGAGIGSKLVQAVLASARDRGVEHLTVHTSPEASELYERNGFRTSSRLLWADGAVEER